MLRDSGGILPGCGGRADIFQDAVRAVWFAGFADASAVEDQEVREDGPVSFRDDFQQVFLYLLGVFVCREAEPVREPPDVGIHNDSFIYAESVPEDDVGGLASDAGEGGEFRHGSGDLAVVVLDEGAGHVP